MSINNTLTLYQYKTGYRYNSDTIFLYDFISKFNPKGNIIDVGCGCGVLGLLVKRDFPNISITQIDVQEEHYNLALKNANVNNIDTNIIQGNFIDVTFNENIDFIISNPPFYHVGSQKSESEILKISRHSESLPLDDFVKKVSKLLKHRGSFIFCYDAKQIAYILLTLKKYNLNPDYIRFVHPNEQKNASLVLIEAKKGSRALNKIMPPLFVFNLSGEFLDEVQEIYKKAKTQSETWKM